MSIVRRYRGGTGVRAGRGKGPGLPVKSGTQTRRKPAQCKGNLGKEKHIAEAQRRVKSLIPDGAPAGVPCVLMKSLFLLSVVPLLIGNGFAMLQQAPAQPAVSAHALSAQAVSALRTKAESGEAEAQLELGKAYVKGNGVSQNNELAAKWFRKAAEQGNADAQDNLGVMYNAGDGVERDKLEALQWYRKAARQGHAQAMFHLGTAYYNGDAVQISDATAYAWFLLAKQAGDRNAEDAINRVGADLKPDVIVEAFNEIATFYDKGEVLQKNDTEASRWWLLAAQRGSQDAKLAIAGRFLSGRGVAQDFVQAKYWCSEAAKPMEGEKNADNRATYCLGYLYENGLGVEKNPKTAREWYERSASAGSAQATKILARMTANGEGGKQDRTAACLMYVQLLRAGDKDAPRRLAELKKQMNKKEWDAVLKQLELHRVDIRQIEASIDAIPAS